MKSVTIDNPADITVIVGYFVIVLSVGIWVSEHVFTLIIWTLW